MRKILKVSLLSNKRYKTGELVNMIQLDAMRLYWLFSKVSQVIFLPIQLVIGLLMISGSLLESSIAGVVVISLMAFLNYLMGKANITVQKNLMREKDKRVKITNEILS